MKGSVIKKGKRWYVAVYMGLKPDGNKDYRWFSGYNTKKEAEDGLLEIRQSIKENRMVDNNSMTATDFFEAWVKDHVEPNLSPGTGDKYRSATLSASASFGSTRIQKVTPHQIQRWVNSMSESELSKSSIVTYYNALKAAFNKAVGWRIIGQTPCVEITLPRVKKKSMKTLTASEVTKLLETAKGHPIELVIQLAASCGLRRGEILGLRWRQVDMNSQVLHLSENYTESSKGVSLSELKSDSSYRSVDFSDSIKRALKHQKAKQLESLVSNSVVTLSNLTEDSLQDLHVCTWYDLQPIRPGFVSSKFRKLLAESKMPQIRFHDLRHTHATLLLQAGVHPKVVQERLGHSKITITLDTYSHVLPSMQKEAAQLLNF